MEAGKNLNTVMVGDKYIFIILLLIILFYCQCSATGRTAVTKSKNDSAGEDVIANKPDVYKENRYNYYTIGIIEQKKGNPRKAIYYFKKAFETDRASEIAHEIASCYLKIDKLTNAENYINQAISISPKNLDHRLMLVNIYLLQQDHKKAISELKKITKMRDDKYEIYFDIGRIYQNIGNYEKAILYYNKVLELDINHEDSLFNLGNIYFNLSRKRKAIKYFENFLKIQKENLEAKFTYAYLLSLTGEYNNAIKIYEELSEILSENSQLSKELAEIFFLLDDKKNCQKYLQLIPDKPAEGNMPCQAMKYQLEDNETAAKGLFLKILQINENDLIANYGLYKIYSQNKNLEKLKNVLITLGKIFYNNENYPYAVKFFNKYKKLFPEDTSSYLYLGIVYESIKQYDKAIEELENALKINADDVKLNFYLGILYEQEKEYKKAIRQFKKVIKLDKKHLHAYIRLSYTYNHLKQDKNAVKILKNALNTIPKEPDLYFLLGVNYSRQEYYDKAIKTFKQGLTYNNSDHLLNFQLAVTYDKKNDKDNAIKQLQKCLELDRDDPEVNNYLAYLYSELSINLEDAKTYIQISLSADYENYAYLDTAGWIYYKMNNLEKAKFYLEKARQSMIKKEKYEAVIYEHLIELYKKLGDQKTVEHYKNYLGSDPH